MRLPGSKNKEKEGRNRVGRNATCVILKSCVELEGHNIVAFTSALPKHESHCQVQGFPWGNWMKVLTHTHPRGNLWQLPGYCGSCFSIASPGTGKHRNGL